MIALPATILQNMAPSDPERLQLPRSLITFPPEILSTIISYVEPCGLANLSRTCQQLYRETADDRIWLRKIQQFLPDFNPLPDASKLNFRALYGAFHPYWFLPQHRLWFCDSHPEGALVLIRFDYRTEYIEAYRFLTSRRDITIEPWDDDFDVHMASFDPRPHLQAYNPEFHLLSQMQRHLDPKMRETKNRITGDRELPVRGRDVTMHAALTLARALPSEAQGRNTATWPTQDFPARDRVRNESPTGFQGGHRPQSLDEASDQVFRRRTWYGGKLGGLAANTVETYSTIDPLVYTPTPAKPWRGIWVGDYSAHGCEFILVHQPDKGASATAIPNPSILSKSRGQWPNPWDGSMVAIKLTGDGNVPRGQTTWRTDKIGPSGTIRVATAQPFQDAHLVRGEGHVASYGFKNGKFFYIEVDVDQKIPGSNRYCADSFVPVQIILQKPDQATGIADRIAIYWEEFGFIAHFHRVDVNDMKLYNNIVMDD